MLVKLYVMLWAFGIAAAVLFFLTGNLTPVSAVVFGFLTFGMVFIGMMNVLPSTVGHNAPVKIKEEKAEAVPAKVKEAKVSPTTAPVHAQ